MSPVPDPSPDDRVIRHGLSLGGASVPRDDCPDANVLAAFLDGRTSAGDRAAVEQHLVDCDLCRTAVLDASSAAAATSHAGVGRLFVRRRAAIIAIAASILVVVGAGIVVLLLQASPRKVVNTESRLASTARALRESRPDLFAGFEPLTEAERAEAPAGDVMRGGLTILEPGGVVLDGRPHVRWTRGAGSTRFEVIVGVEGGAAPRRASTTALELPYPLDAAPLAAGSRVRVKVEGRGPLGLEDSSKTFEVASDADRERALRAFAEIDAESPPDVSSLVRAQFALRRGLLVEAVRAARVFANAHPGDRIGKETLELAERRLAR